MFMTCSVVLVFLYIKYAWMASCAATADGNCRPDEYCDKWGECSECSECSNWWVSPDYCDEISGECCSAAFRTQCPANPAGCTE